MKRISEIDALRGIALFGILLVNIFVFHAPYNYYGEFYGAFEGPQASAVSFVVNFAGGKFLFIFAFLFGYGMYVQHQSRKKDFSRFYIKKMAILLLIGTGHILLFWFGDILASYALLGFVMLALIQLPKKSLLPMGLIFLFFSPLYHLGNLLWGWPMVGMFKPAEMSEFIDVFQSGNYADIFQLRMKEFLAWVPENLVWYVPKTLGLFLFGYYCGQKNFTAHIKSNAISYLILVLLLTGAYIAWTFIKPGFFGSFDLTETPFARPALIAINILFEIALGTAYILGFLLIFQHLPRASKLFANAGRLALSNYIMQSLICVLLFYGYGFGYYAKFQPSDLILIAIAIFGVNLGLSSFYLKYYKQGPLEYVWRKLIRND